MYIYLMTLNILHWRWARVRDLQDLGLENWQASPLQAIIPCSMGWIRRHRWRNFMAPGIQTRTCIRIHLRFPSHLSGQAWTCFWFILNFLARFFSLSQEISFLFHLITKQLRFSVSPPNSYFLIFYLHQLINIQRQYLRPFYYIITPLFLFLRLIWFSIFRLLRIWY